MKKLALLQIGDLHFDAARETLSVDVKDEGIASAVIERAAPTRLTAVMAAVQRLCERTTPDAVVFCGDLTSHGHHSVYEECVRYLDESLGLAEGLFWDQDNVHAVPGNHDVDWRLADPEGVELFAKFEPLTEIWRGREIDVIACDHVRSTRIGAAGAEATIFSVNSCVACGERRSRLGEFKEALREGLELSHHGLDREAEALWEELDTPLFDREHLGEVNEAIDELDRAVLPVVSAHHNLLPQATPRIGTYAELLNGGKARSELAAHGRWVLYLHGHIHADPIEAIEQRHPDSGQVLSISAPEFKDGFNLIEIEFGHTGRPIGCVVTRHRCERGGNVRAKTPIRIGLSAPREETDKIVVGILTALEAGQNMRFPGLKERFDAQWGGAPVEPERFAEALREAEWAGHLLLGDREDQPEFWKVFRDAP